MPGSGSWMLTPSQPYSTRPLVISGSMTRLALLIGMAKPKPMNAPVGEAIQVLMPITSPSMLTSAPPELPGLMAASVWMKSLMFSAGPCVRPTAETMPAVTVDSSPSGLPTARAQSPTCTASESPSTATGMSPAAWNFTRARSMRGSLPTSSPLKVRWSCIRTLISCASPTTWLLVST